MNKKIRIGYLSASDPQNPSAWSGTHYTLFQCLSEIGEVVPLGPCRPKALLLLLGAVHKGLELCTGKRWNYRHSRILCRHYARYFEKKISSARPDVLVAPAASAEVACLQTSISILYITDGTFRICKDYHEALSRLAPFSVTESDEAERKAMQKATAVLVSSEWCARSAIADYGISESKVHVHPFAANMPYVDIQPSDLENIPKEWNLLFISSNWKNKGGDIALGAFQALRKKFPHARLHVVGDWPKGVPVPEGVFYYGYLRKSVSGELQKMMEIFRGAHLLLLPTRFDCTPVTICEASMFGVPTLVSRTGGVEGHLKEGQNGYLMPYDADENAWAEKIAEILSDTDAYVQLRKKSLTLYRCLLNKNAYKEKLLEVISRIIK